MYYCEQTRPRRGFLARIPGAVLRCAFEALLRALDAAAAVVWWVVCRLTTLVGDVMAILLGLALLAVGTLMVMTGIGAVLGVPLWILGFLLVVKGLF